MKLVEKYFNELSALQLQQFGQLQALYSEWNQKINVISRKDIDNLYERHVLHSLAIAKVLEFTPTTDVLDVGTGGGFPGIPLAIMFPGVKFHLIDSIGKKITVVNEVIKQLGLINASAQQIRSNSLKRKFDFVVSRAVTNFPDFVAGVRHCIARKGKNAMPNGILYLKGGDFEEEMKAFNLAEVFPIDSFFDEEYYETKKVIYLPVS